MGEESKSNEELLNKMREVLSNADPDKKVFNSSIDKINDYLKTVSQYENVNNKSDANTDYDDKKTINNKTY